MAIASARLEDARISLKHSIIICKQLKNKRLEWAKTFLNNLIERKISLNGKYYTGATKKILEVLESVEANAKGKNLNLERVFVKTIKADKGAGFIRPRSRFRFRGRRIKSTNITIELEER
ncbi:MAG: uL22 family ribosomal protein [Candidatus Aenigmarchaeota archaeon]|nr:uL22 family ribosomal protein [Candidatus Aenigmarchaeota archaeon]